MDHEGGKTPGSQKLSGNLSLVQLQGEHALLHCFITGMLWYLFHPACEADTEDAGDRRTVWL